MPVSKYLTEIESALRAGNATEHTHRPALKQLVEAIGKKVTATNEPRREKCGAPDYVISLQTKHGPLTLGYLEAKDVGKPLDQIERSEQLTRYREFLPNLILTDYLEFRWYVEGEPRAVARLARVGRLGKLQRNKSGAEDVNQLLREFLEHEPAPIASPRELAQRLARLTHMIRDIIIEAIEGGLASNTLRDLRKAFAQTLIPDLDQPEKKGDFADMYAQTIAYGLFAARCNHRGAGPFRRLGAAAEIPKTNPFLRKLFETITGADLDEEPYAGFVDDVAALLAHADMAAILEHFGKRTRRQDPVVHFYETFLTAYDPKLREARGVYYTPEPVVSYIVRSVDHILKTRFGCRQGLADTSVCEREREGRDGKHVKETTPRVLILDPACGTGTFLYAVVDHIREQFMARGDAGMWSGYVKQHVLPRLFGFELLMAPYAVAHFKLGMQLAGQDLPSDALRKKWAYDFAGGKKDRLKVFLTNTLEGIERAIPDLFGWYRIISDEANLAREVKRDFPIMVVMGNPPYSGHSANKGKWITGLIEDYKRIHGKRIRLGQAKWLQNDYVKFIRFAHHRISRTGYGVIGFITDHSYVDSGTFVAMRACLQSAFDDVYVLNLHGNAKRNRNRPDTDENVFDITQGVSIILAVKSKRADSHHVVRVAELRGTRKKKYDFLSSNDIASTKWAVARCCSPYYLFVSSKTSHLDEYEVLASLAEVMPGSYVSNAAKRIGTGFVSTHDSFAIAFSKKELASNITSFLRTKSEEQARETFTLCSQDQWSYGDAKRALPACDVKRESRLVTYRPFDSRFTLWNKHVCVHRRLEVHRHLDRENVAFCVGQAGNVVGREEWALAWVSANPVDFNLFYRGGCAVLPLYVYPDPERDGSLFANGRERHANLEPKFLANMEKQLRMSFVPDGTGDLKGTFGPEDVLHYIYAVLHSPTYRERYGEFLRIDFPRVPLTGDRKLFRALCSRGKELVALHLLDSPTLSGAITRYPVPGDNLVAKGHPHYVAPGEPEPGSGKPLERGRVYISSDAPRLSRKGQYFEGVPPEVWAFHIGGYQVCEKWLKDRRGRNLSYNDLTHYQEVVVALKETIRLMEDIDAAIPGWPIG